jgi:hypothetical protein
MSLLPTSHKVAPSVDPHNQPHGGTAPHSKVQDPRMTAKAQGVSIVDFLAAGWTEAELRAADFLK